MYKTGDIVEHLPNGWTKLCVERKGGITQGSWDVYLVSPCGRKIRSQVELIDFVNETKAVIDPYEVNMDRSRQLTGLNRDQVSERTARLIEELNRIHNTSIPLPSPQNIIKLKSNRKASATKKHEFKEKEKRYLERQFLKVQQPSTVQVEKMAKQLHCDFKSIQNYFYQRRKECLKDKKKPIQSLGLTELSTIPFPENVDETMQFTIISENGEQDHVQERKNFYEEVNIANVKSNCTNHYKEFII